MSALVLKNISKSYQDGTSRRQILDHLNLEVAAGEFVAILGPSGSGKSTLLTISGMLLSADEGAIIIEKQDIALHSQKERTRYRREHIGFIFQNHQLLPYLNIEDQLRLVAKSAGYSDKKSMNEAIQELLTDLGLYEVRKQYPNSLSGGEKQRVAIARAFINQPDIILADEPTASLDGPRGRQIASMIRQEVKKKNIAALMVTHDERILDLVDTVYRLENGILIKK